MTVVMCWASPEAKRFCSSRGARSNDNKDSAKQLASGGKSCQQEGTCLMQGHALLAPLLNC